MRLTFTIEITRDRPEPPPERESSLDALVDLAETHPHVDRPIGFQHNPEGDQ